MPPSGSRLALGTVQFGLRYGVANVSGRPPEAEITKILSNAAQAGVTVIDTAFLYGDSEAVLGRCLPAGHAFRIVTKTPKFLGLDERAAATALEAAFAQSCARLHASRLYGLLVHDANDLLGPHGDAVWCAMARLRDGGKVTRIGASVYSGTQIDTLLQRYPLDIVQLPLSLLDQRLIAGGQIDRLAARGVEIHARSVFLQGALLMQPDRLPPHLVGLRPALREIALRASRQGIEPLQAALRFVAGLPQVAAVVCGVDTAAHFDELIGALRAAKPTFSAADAAACACGESALLDPSQWSMS